MRSKTPEGKELIVELLISLFKQVKKYQTYSILFIVMISWGGLHRKTKTSLRAPSVVTSITFSAYFMRYYSDDPDGRIELISPFSPHLFTSE